MHIEAADPKHQSAYRPFSWPVTKRGWNIIAAPATTRRLAGAVAAACRRAGPARRLGAVPHLVPDQWPIRNHRRGAPAAGDSALIVERIGHIAFEVLPAWRGHGYGRVLLQYVQTLGEKPAHGNWVLVCPADRPAAVRTVEACGGQLLATMELGDRTLRRYSLTALAAWDDMAAGLI